MERKFKETAVRWTRFGISGLLLFGAGLAIFKGNPVLAGVELVGACFAWPKEKKGSSASQTSHSGSERVLATSFSSRLAKIQPPFAPAA